MFWIINKEKVYSYVVTLSVIGVLFAMSTVIPRNETVETSLKINEFEENRIEEVNTVNI